VGYYWHFYIAEVLFITKMILQYLTQWEVNKRHIQKY